MKYSRSVPALGLALGVSLIWASGLGAQGVEGRVTWTGGEPVAGATATLLDPGFRSVAEAVTDAEGGYNLSAPAPGDYLVVIALEGYPSLMSDQVTLADSEPVTLDLVYADRRVGEAELSMADTLSDAELLAVAISESCQGQFIPGVHGIVFGVVRDTETEILLPSAMVAIQQENPYSMVPGSSELDTRADASGLYLICTAPAGQNLKIRASAEGTEGPWVEKALRAGTMTRIDLEIPLNNPNEPGFILGQVQDQEWGQVIRGVDVTIKDTEFRTDTDARGNFRIPGVPWGEYTIVFEHPSYGTHEQALRVVGGKTHTLEVHLPPTAIEMAPIIVRVRPRRLYGDMVGLQERIDRGVGTIMTRTQIDERQPMNLADLLRGIPGVDVVQSGSSLTGNYEIRMRNAQNMMGQICPPAVWVDGQKWRNATGAYTIIQGIEMEVVEVYNGPSEVPGEFLDSDASCGAIIVWTRRGRSFGG